MHITQSQIFEGTRVLKMCLSNDLDHFIYLSDSLCASNSLWPLFLGRNWLHCRGLARPLPLANSPPLQPPEVAGERAWYRPGSC